MTVSLAGFESVSAKTRFVVPELPSTTTASLASRKGRVCAGALRLTRQSSRKRAIRRLQLFREKLEAATIPNTARVNSESVSFLQFFSTQYAPSLAHNKTLYRRPPTLINTPLQRGDRALFALFEPLQRFLGPWVHLMSIEKAAAVRATLTHVRVMGGASLDTEPPHKN